jgi:hypothetical protein
LGLAFFVAGDVGLGPVNKLCKCVAFHARTVPVRAGCARARGRRFAGIQIVLVLVLSAAALVLGLHAFPRMKA